MPTDMPQNFNFRFILCCAFCFLLDASFAQQKPVMPGAAKPAGFKLFFEKVYLQTDRNLYASGDNLWFKAYLVNGLSTSLTNTSNNLDVELISPEATIISREIIRMDNGLGNGDFKLSDTIPDGNYRLRAYTNWMRNFGDNFVFEKAIAIHHIPGSATGKSVATHKKTPVKTVLANAGNGTIRFFPEGGLLVQDVQSIIGFKAEDDNSNGLKVSGSIISSKGDTVSRFQSAASGMGSFAFLPAAGLQYQVKGVFSNGHSFTESLPAALPKGFSLHLNVADTATVTATISTNAATLADMQGKELILAGKHGTQVCFGTKIKISGLETTVKVAKNSFPAGVAAITLYDEQLHPTAERLIYVEGNDNITLSILSDKRSYQPKDGVTLHLKTTNQNQQPVSASLSLAAVDAGILPEEQRNIQSYFLLESEVRGKIENAAQYFDKNNPNRYKQLDALLLTQGWRNFIWKRLADTALKISYLPEPGFTITGRLRDRLADKPQANMNITLFAAGAKDGKLFTTRTASDGKYFLDGIQFYGPQTIRLSARDEKGKKTGMILLDTISGRAMAVQPVREPTPTSPQQLMAFNQAIEKREPAHLSMNDTLQLKGITVTEAAQTVTLRDQTVQTFGYPDYNFDITKADYTYKDLEDFLVHKVPGAQSNPDTSEGIVFYSQGKKILPRFIVQRQEDVFERLDYYSLTMDVITRVSVRHLVGMGGTDVFLIYLTLKPEAFQKKEFYLINADVNGYYEAREFYTPKNSIGQPDLRTTLFWKPNIVTDANGEASVHFTNSAQKTTIRIVAEGITDKGIAVAGKAEYPVQ
ncbi:MG2 domain-containing protein [Mucilaginibacter arboris]|uniref:Macroglobulin domain-containing protein n=1 Tax=Mucilaginibacter arboris TaxID=2682090 RepID=A0A7K1T1I1_9SPHI|nr:MG2 domain-containing protein [Mucilaginibacter arboris]MVN23436.1 hypothetical protein [Mucilaginibacter arboris]